MPRWTFTSESVTEGHPDKMSDQVSDAVLDAILAEDPNGRVACETMLTTGLCVVAGEITTSAYVDIPRIARDLPAIDRVMNLHADDPDIAPFLDNGGKLILYHGWVDPLVAGLHVAAGETLKVGLTVVKV